MGSSRPNCFRRFIRTSGGTFGLVASSSKGSPGASARTVKSTRLIPARTGIRMIRRRMKYLDIGERAGMPPRPSTALLPLAVPVLERQAVGIPAAALDLEATADGRHRRTLNDRDDDDVRDHEIVHPDEQCGPLDRIH